MCDLLHAVVGDSERIRLAGIAGVFTVLRAMRVGHGQRAVTTLA